MADNLHPYFDSNPVDWNQKTFLDGGSKLYQWRGSLREIERDYPGSPHSIFERTRAKTLLNQDALHYFSEVAPTEWSAADFVRFTGRGENSWSWALHHQMSELSKHSESTNNKVELLALERCFGELYRVSPKPSQSPGKSGESNAKPNSVDTKSGDASSGNAKKPATTRKKRKQRSSNSPEPPKPAPTAKAGVSDKPARSKLSPSPHFHPTKWRLSSTRIVEECLVQAETTTHRELHQSLIVVIDDSVQRIFTPEEREELERFAGKPAIPKWSIPRLPQKKEDLPSFSRDQLGSDHPEDAAVWLASVLLCLYIDYKNPFFYQHIGEIGYACVWSKLLDSSLLGSEFYISRGEQESKIEKDYLRLLLQRPGSGKGSDKAEARNAPKYDGILKGFVGIDVTGDAEFGYMELARERQRDGSRKKDGDERKMVNAMRLSLLSSRSGGIGQEEWLKQFRVAIFCSGLQLRVLYLTPGKGSVFLLRRRPKVVLPREYSASGVRMVLNEIAYFRALVTGDGFLDGSLDGMTRAPSAESLD